jgi:hypothetical protein
MPPSTPCSRLRNDVVNSLCLNTTPPCVSNSIHATSTLLLRLRIQPNVTVIGADVDKLNSGITDPPWSDRPVDRAHYIRVVSKRSIVCYTLPWQWTIRTLGYRLLTLNDIYFEIVLFRCCQVGKWGAPHQTAQTVSRTEFVPTAGIEPVTSASTRRVLNH